jgi:hypothetical protein
LIWRRREAAPAGEVIVAGVNFRHGAICLMQFSNS